METARCKAFLAAVDTGSFSKAAEVLGYTPSGVSQLVNALEGELGFPLLLRNRRGVSLSANGEMLLPAVRSFLQQENHIFQLAADVQGLAVGSVTIAAFSSIATHWLPEIIRDFQALYPQIQIRIMEGVRQEVCSWMTELRADMGFLSYQEPMPAGYDWIPLAEDRMLAVLPKDHPLAGAAVYPLKSCQNERFIMPALGRDDDVFAMFARNGLSPKIRFSTLGNYATLSMIEQGLGMSIMNELITRNWQCDVVMMPVDPPQSITMGIALPSLKDASPAVRRFVDFSVKRLTQGEKRSPPNT